VLGLVRLESISTPSVTALVLSMRDTCAAVQDAAHREDHDDDQSAGRDQQRKGSWTSSDREQ
jgi:hypothetical protein